MLRIEATNGKPVLYTTIPSCFSVCLSPLVLRCYIISLQLECHCSEDAVLAQQFIADCVFAGNFQSCMQAMRLHHTQITLTLAKPFFFFFSSHLSTFVQAQPSSSSSMVAKSASLLLQKFPSLIQEKNKQGENLRSFGWIVLGTAMPIWAYHRGKLFDT